MSADLGTVDAEGARRALRLGQAVVLPNPSPLTSAVAGTDPRAVNTVKGRPADQAVALWVHHARTLGALTGVLALNAEGTAVARRLLTDERVTLLVPLSDSTRHPHWLAPASQDGWALLFGARWAPLLPVVDDFPVLYVSSANSTGHPPAATAREAVAMFPPATAVLGTASLTGAGEGTSGTGEGTGGTDDDRPRRSATTTLRLHPDGRIDLHRHGAQDRAFPSTEQYLDHLRTTHRGE